MKTIYEGEYRNVAVDVKRKVGSTGYTVTAPERRVLDASQAIVTGYDWAAATYDSVTNKVIMLFDRRVAALTPNGTYFVQLRAVITPTAGSAERYVAQITVVAKDFGP